MKSPFPNPDRPIAILGKLTLGLFVLYGILLTLVPILPLWLDEWLLLDNLKFKSAHELWGPLEHTQQFPRLYLSLIKAIAAPMDYSYTSLRIPAFLAHCAGLALLWRLSLRLFPSATTSRWLWIMIYVSFNTSIHYFVQLKQYTMEMALSLLAIWQLLELLRPDPPPLRRLMLVVASLLLAPFFSYTYPIVLAPVLIMVGLQCLRERRLPGFRFFPIAVGCCAIAVIYVIDTRQVLADPGMQDFWRDLLMKSFSPPRFATNVWMMFCTLGAGDLFGTVFGILGVAGFLRASWLALRTRLDPGSAPVLLYSCLLVWIAIVLFIAGKLPLGTFRLNSFLVPALGFMIVDLLRALAGISWLRIPAKVLPILLFLAATGNVYTVMAELFSDEHRKKLAVYESSDAALRAARQRKLPVLVSSVIAFPFEDRWAGDWILKVQPAYRVRDSIRVFPAPANAGIAELKSAQPDLRGQVLYLDGPVWKVVELP